MSILELALQGEPSAATEFALAEAYARLGKPDLAASHRERAGQLSKE